MDHLLQGLVPLSSCAQLLSLLCGHLETAATVKLHVSHSAYRLNLGMVSTPLIPVLEGSTLQDILVATVTWVLVCNPPEKRSIRTTDWVKRGVL